MKIKDIILHRLQIPLTTPYHLAFGDLHHFDTVLVEVGDGDGGTGFGDATVIEAYSGESIDATWAFCRARAQEIVGDTAAGAHGSLMNFHHDNPFAVTSLVSAIEMLEGNAILAPTTEQRVPLLIPTTATALDAIPAEIDDLIGQGYGTLKIKVGFHVDDDLLRFATIQKAAAGRVLLRLDGNQGYSQDQACAFASQLDPQDVELLEQPCADDDWDAAVAVARVSTVPMMLDESIFGIADIERAADLEAAAFIKLKLMKMGGLDRTLEGLERVRALGMEPVLGNGVATDAGCWMEACIAARVIRNAGEMNGYLKPVGGVFAEPLTMDQGAIILSPGFKPRLDADKVAAFTVATERFGTSSASFGTAAQ